MSELNTYINPSGFTTEKGEIIRDLKIAYSTFGKLNADKSNVVWICHALTANSNPVEWWPGIVGDGCVFNPSTHFIVCANIIGSCYGSTSPLDVAANGKTYFRNFPLITVRDMVNAHKLLAVHLNIEGIQTLAGGSLGGWQCLEWAIDEPQRIKQLFLIATNAVQSAYGIATNEAQRMAIEADATFFDDTEKGGLTGMKAARAMALITYRTYNAFNRSQREETNETLDNFRASSYQQYQGQKLSARFNAYSYYALSKSMDTHNVGRKRGGIEKALQLITAKTLVAGISSDVKYPLEEQRFLAQHIRNSKFEIVESDYGHDGFLTETGKITSIIQQHLHV